MKQLNVIKISLILLLIVGAFQNCAESMDLSQYDTASTTPPPPPGAAAVAPDITSQSADHVALVGEKVDFAVRVTGSNLTFQWFKNNVLVPSATTSSFSILSAKTTDSGLYKVVATNLKGSDTAEIALTVKAPEAVTPLPPVITMQPKALTVVKFSELTSSGVKPALSVTATGATSYQWFFRPISTTQNPKPAFAAIPGATSATHVVNIDQSLANYMTVFGAYKVRAINAAGFIESAVAEVTLDFDVNL